MKPNKLTAAICGLFCGTCPCYPNDCHGCLSEKLTAHCITCPNGFRDCAKNNNVIRCYECKNFPCEKLDHFSKDHWQNGLCHHAEVIVNLAYMQEHGIDAWVQKQTADNTCEKCGRLIYWFDKENHICEE